MAKFMLLAGIHQGRDLSAEPTKVERQTRTGKLYEEDVYPLKTYKAGDVVECDTDLVALLGADKFAYAGEPPGRRVQAPGGRNLTETSAAPHGQVSDGHQIAADSSVAGKGPVQSRAASADEVEKLGLQPIGAIPPTDPVVKAKAAAPLAASPAATGSGDESDDYDSWTLSDLRDHARKTGISLHGATNKAEVIEAIREAESDD